jgi:hypothetical protein
MTDEYADLMKGHIRVRGNYVVSGRIEWLMDISGYKGMKFHTEPLTAEQAQRLDEGPIQLNFFDTQGEPVGIEEGTIRADSPVLEGATATILTPPNHGTWDLNL